MHRLRLGFAAIAAGQFCYLIDGLSSGFGLGSAIDATSVLCAIAAAASPSAGKIGLSVLAAVQVVDLATSLLDPDLHLLGFALVGIGLVLAAIAAWRGVSLRPGAILAAIGSASYLVFAWMNGEILSLFVLGAVFTASGWAVLALLPSTADSGEAEIRS